MAGERAQMIVRIAANLEELKRNLAEGRSSIETTTAGMQKLASSLDGSKLEQRAHNITAAINSIGGATKLTDAEAARHLKTLDSWIAKADRLGKEVPADILKTRDALAKVPQPLNETDQLLGKIWTGLKSAAGLMGVAFSAQAVIGFAGKVFDTASNIHDMALKLGISAEAVQGFKFAAEQAGSSLDAVGTAITKMNQHLAEGDKATVGALRAAGLGFHAIRAMKPEDAFLAITDAVARIPDPMEQSRVALALFGKGAAELLPAIKEGFREAADSATKMSNETVNSLEAAQDAWTKLGNTVVIVSGTMIAHTMTAAKEITSSWASAALFAENVIKFGPAIAFTMTQASDAAKKASAVLTEAQKASIKHLVEIGNTAKAIGESGVFGEASEAARKYAESLKVAAPQIHRTKEEQDALNKAAREAAAAIKTQTDAIDVFRAAEVPLMVELRAVVDLMQKKGMSVGQIATALHVSEIQVKNYTESMKALRDMGEKTIPLLTEHWKHHGDALKNVTDVNGDLTKGYVPLINANLAAAKAGLWPTEVADRAKVLAEALDDVGFKMGDVVTVWQRANSAFGDVATILNAIPGKIAEIGAMAARAGQAIMKNLAEGNVWGAVVAGVTAAVGIIGKLFGGATEYEKRMKKAAEETVKLQGELVTSHKNMQQLILDADMVGINIREAFKWKDPEALKNIIGEMDEKTRLLNDAMKEYGFTWEDTAARFRGAKLAQLFEELFAKTEILKGAGIDYSEILSRQAMQYSDLVDSAIRTGTEIPASMRPVLEDLVAMGKLVDENGVAFTDLSSIPFAETMTQGFTKVVDKLDELIEKITNGVGGALEDIGRKVYTPRITPYVENPEGGPPIEYGGPQAAGGDYVVTRPTMFLAGEAGPERVTFSGANRAYSGGGGAAVIEVHSHTYVDGRHVKETVERHQVNDLKDRARLGRR